MSDFDYTVSLRIRHPSIDPRELTKKLGFTPQYSWCAGERKRDASSDAGDARYRETYWLGRLPTEAIEAIPDLPVDNALMFALLRIQRSQAFWNRLLTEGGTARLIIEIFGAEDFTLDLSPSTLAMLARCRVSISVDVHTELRAVA